MPKGYGIHGNAEHIAAFSPEVADVLAAALDQHADDHAEYDECRWEPCLLVDFAREYLGERYRD